MLFHFSDRTFLQDQDDAKKLYPFYTLWEIVFLRVIYYSDSCRLRITHLDSGTTLVFGRTGSTKNRGPTGPTVYCKGDPCGRPGPSQRCYCGIIKRKWNV